VVPAGRSQTDRHALIDTHSQQTVKVYRSRELPISDAEFLSQRTTTKTAWPRPAARRDPITGSVSRDQDKTN
jgi:hypothetical protein